MQHNTSKKKKKLQEGYSDLTKSSLISVVRQVKYPTMKSINLFVCWHSFRFIYYFASHTHAAPIEPLVTSFELLVSVVSEKYLSSKSSLKAKCVLLIKKFVILGCLKLKQGAETQTLTINAKQKS